MLVGRLLTTGDIYWIFADHPQQQTFSVHPKCGRGHNIIQYAVCPSIHRPDRDLITDSPDKPTKAIPIQYIYKQWKSYRYASGKLHTIPKSAYMFMCAHSSLLSDCWKLISHADLNYVFLYIRLIYIFWALFDIFPLIYQVLNRWSFPKNRNMNKTVFGNYWKRINTSSCKGAFQTDWKW